MYIQVPGLKGQGHIYFSFLFSPKHVHYTCMVYVHSTFINDNILTHFDAAFILGLVKAVGQVRVIFTCSK